VAEQLRLAVLAAYDQLFGLDLEHLAVDGCITKAPCGGQSAGPSPVDRRKQGLLAATLDTIGVVGVLPERPVVHLDAGYDYQPCRQVLAERLDDGIDPSYFSYCRIRVRL
jgi:hypothetical protein